MDSTVKVGLGAVCSIYVFGVSFAVSPPEQQVSWVFEDEARGSHAIFIEAERLRSRSGWRAGVTAYCDSQPHVCSRGKLGADQTNAYAEASTDIDVPAAGAYNLWVHYDAVCAYDTTFGVQLIQDADEVQLDAGFGGRDQLRWVPWGHGWSVHHKDWSWHHADSSWQKARVTLAKGWTRLVLYKGGQGGHGLNGDHAAWRFVDCMILTNALADEPANRGGTYGFLEHTIDTFSLYLRITVPDTFSEPVPMRTVTPVPHRRPYYRYGEGLCTREGHVSWPFYRPPKPEHLLAPGESSPWCRIPTRLVGENRVRVYSQVLRNDAEQPLGGTKLEFSLSPDGSPVLRTFVVPAGKTEFVLWTTRDPDRPEELQSMDEIRARYRRALAQANTPGRKPTRFLNSVTIWGLRHATDDVALLSETGMTLAPPELAKTRFDELGFAGIFARGGRTGSVREMFAAASDRERTRTTLKELKQRLLELGHEDTPIIMKTMDEPQALPLPAMAREQRFQDGFQQYARERGIEPRALLPAPILKRHPDAVPEEELWQLVRLATEPTDAGPALFYHSQRYRSRAFTDYWAVSREMQEAVFGTQLTGSFINLSPSNLGGGTGFHGGFDYFDLTRRLGQRIAWSESWHENLPMLVTWMDGALNDVLRGAVRGVPGGKAGCHVIISPGRAIRPESAMVKAAVNVAHGMDILDWYCEYPYGELDGLPFRNEPALLAIKRVNYAIGAVESILLESTIRHSGIALLWPRSTYIHDSAHESHDVNSITVPVNAYEQEFIHIHAALAQAGFHADIVNEDDLIAGRLEGYKVLYLVADQIEAQAADAIKHWVQAGGVLYATAGGGLRDEHSQPLDTLAEVYGIKTHALHRAVPGLKHKVTLAGLEPIDVLEPVDADRLARPLQAYCILQSFELDAGMPLARGANGIGVLAVEQRYGKGRSYIVGTLPGVAMMKPAFRPGLYARSTRPEDLHIFDPTGFDDNARDWITLPVREAGLVPAAVCDPPFVEAVVRETDTHYLVCLANHSVTAGTTVVLRFPGTEDITSVRSQQLERELPVKDGRVALTIDYFDFLTAPKPGK